MISIVFSVYYSTIFKKMDDVFERFKATAKKLVDQFDERIKADFHVDSLNPSVLLTNKRHQQTLQSVGVLTCSFYLLTNAFQRAAGVVSLHSGKPFLLTAAAGLVSTTASCILAREFHDSIALPRLFGGTSSALKGNGGWLSLPQTANQLRAAKDEDMVRNALVGVGMFSLFERRSFLTALPSSVITLGAYAQRNMLVTRYGRGFVPATDVAATDKQRRMIQSIGQRFGCHQCGSRQMFTKGVSSFIADHQPPTKMALLWSDQGWRKALRWPVAQRLWPQCQKCFHLQGSAVRTHTHTLIHHHRVRLCHFAPAAAALLLWSAADQPAVRDWLEDCLDPVVVPAAKAVGQARRLLARAVG